MTSSTGERRLAGAGRSGEAGGERTVAIEAYGTEGKGSWWRRRGGEARGSYTSVSHAGNWVLVAATWNWNWTARKKSDRRRRPRWPPAGGAGAAAPCALHCPSTSLQGGTGTAGPTSQRLLAPAESEPRGSGRQHGGRLGRRGTRPLAWNPLTACPSRLTRPTDRLWLGPGAGLPRWLKGPPPRPWPSAGGWRRHAEMRGFHGCHPIPSRCLCLSVRLSLRFVGCHMPARQPPFLESRNPSTPHPAFH